MDAVETLRRIGLGLAVLGALCFADAPFRTFRQRFVEQRSRARLVLVSLELDLIGLWAVGRFYLHRDFALAPPAAAPVLAALGLAVLTAGIGLSVWAKFRLGRWFSATFAVKEGHELVTDGPYAVTRHPIYTGILIALAGAGLLADSGLTLILAPLFALPLFLHTVYEEHLFERHFGAPYFEYQRTVPRLLPFVRPRP